MSVEFNLGHQDHQKVEDFLASRPSGVGAITLHATYARHQLAAAEAAREAGASVLYDPRTERLAYPDPDGATEKLPGWTGAPYDLDVLAARQDLRRALVDQVLEAHPTVSTIVTPPSFFVADARSAHLNLALAEATRLSSTQPVRPRVLLSSRVPVALVTELTTEYRRAGVTQIDLRISPLSGENDGIRKIRQVFKFADIFSEAGIAVTLGTSGNIGQVAFALGYVASYSVGIGENEHVDHAGRVNRQAKPPAVRRDENGRKLGGGGWEGIYLPGLAVTVSRKQGETLLAHTDIRTRIGCRIGSCAHSIAGPLQDYKAHYLHARAAEMAQLVQKPKPWRITTELDRMERALELRRLVNDRYRADGQPTLKTRTLSSLVDGINQERAAA